jgi:hypothetical protein
VQKQNGRRGRRTQESLCRSAGSNKMAMESMPTQEMMPARMLVPCEYENVRDSLFQMEVDSESCSASQRIPWKRISMKLHAPSHLQEFHACCSRLMPATSPHDTQHSFFKSTGTSPADV